eukprot:3950345-Prymnesium_polylepis.1
MLVRSTCDSLDQTATEPGEREVVIAGLGPGRMLRSRARNVGRHVIPVAQRVERGCRRHGVGEARLVSEQLPHGDVRLATCCEGRPVRRDGIVHSDATCLLYTSPSPRDAHES